jgi:hypothetical protein
MGAQTQAALCPPGKSRRLLQQALEKKKSQTSPPQQRTRQPSMRFDSEMTAELEKMLGSTQALLEKDSSNLYAADNSDEEEEASSGDEDELFAVDDIISPDTAPSLDDEKKYATLGEPLFGTDSTSSSSKASSPSSTTSGKLPFNRRKLRYFDHVTATDSKKARAYLRQEVKKAKRRDGILLRRHLRKMQREQVRRLQLERGETPDSIQQDEENEEETLLLKSGVAPINEPMTPSLAAALILESLSLNPKESIEGMAKCYDGIVAAGVALLDSQQQLVSSEQPESARPRRSVIMAALEPLLITSLEQASGEVMLQLAKLRRMCGTPRYQRRFVQRIAPCLVRPPHAAMWCLQHQNDMEPILAAVEMIFDASFDLFKKGWYERGQLLLADSVRKETLNSAAQQLKNLSSVPEDGPGYLALNSTISGTHHHGMMQRRPKLLKGTARQDRGDGSAAPLAEWEVIAVDRQIRTSISNILSNDWSRVAIVSRDVETALKNRRPGSNVTAPSLARSRSGGEATPPSPKSTPTSPKRTTTPPGKAPLSPPSPKATARIEPPATESIESVFGPSFASQSPSAVTPAEGSAPPAAPTTPVSPPIPKRKSFDEGESSTSPHKGQFLPASSSAATSSSSVVSDSSSVGKEKSRTPPRSPGSPAPNEETMSVAQASLKAQAASSPVRGNHSPEESTSAQNNATSSPSHPSFASLERVERAPLSPSGSVASDAAHRAASSGASVASNTTASSQPSHYRMLTSTAAERKRTVAACRALRAQISRFEEAFMQLHGRAPKGAAERAPLATTYAQYREWKRAIRADAACRIQALFRGARCRWTLLRGNNPRITRVIMTRAGRASFVAPPATPVDTNKSEEAMMKQLSIPREIDAKDAGRGPRIGSNIRAVAPSQPAFDEAFSTSTTTASSAPLTPQWSTPGRRTSGSSTSTPPPYTSPQGSPSPTGAGGSYQIPLSELQARKKELKQQLKQYDMNFARQHGRMPVKAEKEPIRHLYESYNALKSQIQLMEQEGQHLPPSVVQTRSSPRSMSPPLAVVSGPESSDESPPSASIMRPRRKPKRPSPPLAEGSSSSASSASPPQDLQSLKAEKQQLHQMLRSYEKDFFREHKRQVSSFADIKPVASQYRRYKEIKKAIATLQQSGER